MLATRTSQWIAGAVLGCAVVLAVTWFLLIAPRRAEAADLHAQQVSAQQANGVLRAKVDQLRAQYAQLPQTEAELAQLRRQLTPTADLPNLIRSISALSTAAGTDLQTVTPGVPTALSAAAGAASATGSASEGTGAGGSAAGTAASGRGGVIAVPMSIVATGDYYQAVGFVRQLQTQMSRALLVTGIQIDQDSGGTSDGVRLSITGQVFVLPDQASASASPSSSLATSSSASPAAAVASSSGSGSQ